MNDPAPRVPPSRTSQSQPPHTAPNASRYGPSSDRPQPEAEQREQPTAPRADNPARRRRTRFWAGFAAGFLLLSTLSCGALFTATGLSRINLRDLQAGGQVWTPPPVTPTPEAAETPIIEESQTVATGVFQPGEQLRNATSSVVNVRATPGYLSKPAGDVIAQVPPGGNVEVVGDRAMADNLTWWLIRYRPAGGSVVEGWMAEATASGVQILAR